MVLDIKCKENKYTTFMRWGVILVWGDKIRWDVPTSTIMLDFFFLFRGGCCMISNDSSFRRTRNSHPRASIIIEVSGVLSLSSIVIYVLARLTLFVEAFTALRHLPPGAYAVVKWTSFLLHMWPNYDLNTRFLRVGRASYDASIYHSWSYYSLDLWLLLSFVWHLLFGRCLKIYWSERALHRWLLDDKWSIVPLSSSTVLVQTHDDAGFPSHLKVEIMGNWKGHLVTGFSKVAE